MIAASFQAVFAALAAALLYRLTQAALPNDPRLRVVFVAGFAARAFAGQALFWISWLHLPIAPGLQVGNGLWFFAFDAHLYVSTAFAAATQGWGAIIHMTRIVPSVMFVQALAAFLRTFGAVTSTALLLNLFSYTATIAIITRWARHERRARIPAAIAITAVSLSPSMILWSTQPLKDTFFAFLVVAFAGACAEWQRAWLASEDSVANRVISGALQVVLLFAVAGIRWYVAFALFLAATAFLLMTGLRTRQRRLVSIAASIAIAALLSRSVVAGAGPNLPAVVSNILTPTHGSTITQLPASLVAAVDDARTRFVSAGGATSIRTGTTLGTVPPAAVSAAQQTSPTAAAASPKVSPVDAVRAEALVRNQVSDWNHDRLDSYMNAFVKSPELTVSVGPAVVRGWQQMNAVAIKTIAHRQPDERLFITDVRIEPTADGSVVVRGRWHRSVNREEVLEAEQIDTVRRVGDEWKIVKAVTLPVARRSPVAQMKSRSVTFASGVAAVIVPQRVGEWLGLFAIHGGRGMMWFTEIDTIVFDVVLVFALAALTAHFGASVRNPIVWLVVMLTILVGAPLVYTVTNFGTLFRLRDMLYVAILLIPISVASSCKAEDAGPTSPTATAPVD
jgi:hypothetical protein